MVEERRMSESELGEAYAFMQDAKRRNRFGGSHAQMRHVIWRHVTGRPEPDYSRGMSSVEWPTQDWSIPPTYMVAFMRTHRGMSRGEAIRHVQRTYPPSAREKSPTVATLSEQVEGARELPVRSDDFVVVREHERGVPSGGVTIVREHTRRLPQ